MLGRFCKMLYPRSLSWKSKVDVVRVGIDSQTSGDIEAFKTEAKSPCVTAAMTVSVAPLGPKVSWLANLLQDRYIMSTATIEQ